MAARKPTTTEDLTASAESAAPTPEERVQDIVDNTDPDVVAKVDEVKTQKVKSPTGAVTEVPESIVQALLDSGYSKTR